MWYYFSLFYPSYCLVFHTLFLSFRVNILKISFKRKKFFIQQRQKHVSSPFSFAQVVILNFFFLKCKDNKMWMRRLCCGNLPLKFCFVNLSLLFWCSCHLSVSHFCVISNTESFHIQSVGTVSLLCRFLLP